MEDERQVTRNYKTWFVAATIELLGMCAMYVGERDGIDDVVFEGFLLAMVGIGLWVGTLAASFASFWSGRRKGGE